MSDHQTADPGDARRAGGSAQALSVVIVDSRDLYRESLKMALETRDPGLRVREAPSLEEAIRDVANGDEADVIVVNTDASARDCPACLASLSALRANRLDVAVLVVCGSDPCRQPRAAVRSGAKGFVTPAASVDLLAGALRVVGAGGTCLPASIVGDDPPETPPDHPSFTTLARLSPRQRKVFALVCEGRSNKEIGCALELAEGTVKAHVSAILKRLDVSSRTQAALMASGLARSDRAEGNGA